MIRIKYIIYLQIHSLTFHFYLQIIILISTVVHFNKSINSDIKVLLKKETLWLYNFYLICKINTKGIQKQNFLDVIPNTKHSTIYPISNMQQL